jgi:hypothetical protein
MHIGRPIGGTSEANIMVAAEHVATPERLKIRKSQLIVWTMYGLIGTAAPCDVSTSYSPMAMGGPCVFMGMQVNTQKNCQTLQLI